MDFGSLIVLALIVTGVIFVRRQIFRSRAMSFGRQQANALEALAQSFPGQHSTALAMKKGEEFVYEAHGVALMETRTGARRSRRTIGALTFRVAPGVFATGGAGGSVSPPPPEHMTAIDQGYAVFSNQRVVFVGSMHTREWAFSKLLGATPFQSSGVLMAVSNRQKMSGIVPTHQGGLSPWVAFQIAQHVAEHGVEAAKQQIADAITDAHAQVDFIKSHLWATRSSVEQFQRQQARAVTATPTNPATSSQVVGNRDESAVPDGRSGAQLPATIDVVGESFHPESMATLRKYFRSKGKSEHIVEAELRCDPDNPHSPSGKAVAVFIRDMLVGHIPEAIAPTVFDQVDAEGGTLMVGSRLWLDSPRSKPNKSSVVLFVDSRLSI
ncbi:HIRAN domain-containing protein [Pontimonas salivibrio]|uniref:HIRAN domain-containing protein n=2 Tax=Pontimonas salivibrio TaxID=1159327 RepID=A0A2L2BRL2_9MICO|nr:HIRAN domain-containing protein [Pontimonas salivibrio]